MHHHAKAGVKIAPISLPGLLQYAYSNLLLGKFENAIEILEQILELDPLFRAALEGLALVHVSMEDYDTALMYIEKYLDLIDAKYKGGTQLGYIAALMGNKKLAEENLEIIRKREKDNPDLNLSLDFASVYAALGKTDLVFKYLNKAVDEKLGAILFIKTMLPLQSLHDDDRFHKILQKIGLEEKD